HLTAPRHALQLGSEEALDPQIRDFIARMKAAFARHPSFDHLTFAERRAVAEAVRRPWRDGGPEMAAVTERRIATDGGNVRIRIYRPTPQRANEPDPVLVYLHGGGWTLFSLDTHDRVMREYAHRAGVVVVGVDYALAPEAPFPAALEQVVAVARWLGSGGAGPGVDPAKIAIGGDSAGGNLSVGAALM